MAIDKLQYAIGNSASTTLSSSITNADTTAALTSDTNFEAKTGEGMVIIDEGQATEELAYSTGKTGASLSIPLANRGVEGGSAQAHSAGATVKGIMSSGMWNNLIDVMINFFDKTTGALDTTKVVTPTGTQTLTNKTLTAPKIADGGYIADANGNELIKGETTASAVNEVTVTNAATTESPSLSATGDDTNIDLDLIGKGTGVVTTTVRRQGGSATDWSTAGTTNYTESDVFIQCGKINTNSGVSTYAVTFPVAFSQNPLVLITSESNVTEGTGLIRTISTTGFNIVPAAGNAGTSHNWVAIGKR